MTQDGTVSLCASGALVAHTFVPWTDLAAR